MAFALMSLSAASIRFSRLSTSIDTLAASVFASEIALTPMTSTTGSGDLRAALF